MRRWKKYAAAAMAAAAVCTGILPAAAAELKDPGTEEAAEEKSAFQILPAEKPVQSYGSGDYQIDVFGDFTRMTDGNGASSALEGSRLLYKRGTVLAVSSDFDFYNGRPDQVVVDSVSGSSGTAQYLSVLEKDRSIEDYYTDIRWPKELANSNIVEISSTLDTGDTVLMVRYKDRTVAAFNYVTGALLFRDDSEKTELGFGEYVEGWLTDTWDSLTGDVNADYVQVEEIWQQAGDEHSAGFLPPGGQAVQNGESADSGIFLTGDGENLEAGDGTFDEDARTGENGSAEGPEQESVLVAADGRLTEQNGAAAETEPAAPVPPEGAGQEIAEMQAQAGEETEPAVPGETAGTADAEPAEGERGGGDSEPDIAGVAGVAGMAGEAADGAEAGDAPGAAGEQPGTGAAGSGVGEEPGTEAVSGGAGTGEEPGTETAGSGDAPGAAGEQAEETGLPGAAANALLTVYDPVTETYVVCRTDEYLSSGGQERRTEEQQGGTVTRMNVESVAASARTDAAGRLGGWAVALAALAGSGILLLILYFGNRRKTD